MRRRPYLTKKNGQYTLSFNQYAEESQTRDGQVQNYRIVSADTIEIPYLFVTNSVKPSRRIAAVQQSNNNSFLFQVPNDVKETKPEVHHKRADQTCNHTCINSAINLEKPAAGLDLPARELVLILPSAPLLRNWTELKRCFLAQRRHCGSSLLRCYRQHRTRSCYSK